MGTRIPPGPAPCPPLRPSRLEGLGGAASPQYRRSAGPAEWPMACLVTLPGTVGGPGEAHRTPAGAATGSSSGTSCSGSPSGWSRSTATTRAAGSRPARPLRPAEPVPVAAGVRHPARLHPGRRLPAPGGGDRDPGQAVPGDRDPARGQHQDHPGLGPGPGRRHPRHPLGRSGDHPELPGRDERRLEHPPPAPPQLLVAAGQGPGGVAAGGERGGGGHGPGPAGGSPASACSAGPSCWPGRSCSTCCCWWCCSRS